MDMHAGNSLTDRQLKAIDVFCLFVCFFFAWMNGKIELRLWTGRRAMCVASELVNMMNQTKRVAVSLDQMFTFSQVPLNDKDSRLKRPLSCSVPHPPPLLPHSPSHAFFQHSLHGYLFNTSKGSAQNCTQGSPTGSNLHHQPVVRNNC